MRGLLSRLLGMASPERIAPPASLGFYPPFDHPWDPPVRGAPNAPFNELAALGTHAFVVTDWQPGPTTWRPVNRMDLPNEPLRRTYSTKGPLVLAGDMNVPLFQGEKTPPVAGGGIAAANDFIEAYALAQRQGGWPS